MIADRFCTRPGRRGFGGAGGSGFEEEVFPGLSGRGKFGTGLSVSNKQNKAKTRPKLNNIDKTTNVERR